MGGDNGLKKQWGVDDPAKAGSDAQSQQFQATFQKEITVINGHLQYTSANAEAVRHDPLAARRDALYPAFQAASGQIDKTNPAKAQPAIDKVLADEKALGQEVATFRKEAEKAKNDWQTRQAKFDTAVHQVEEVEAWGDAKAATLRTLVDGIRSQVNDRKYAPATATVDQLLPKLKPIYDDYLKQKEAKPKHEQMLAEQSARLDPLKTAERPSQPMTAKAGEADAAIQQAKEKGDAKDYVGGIEQLKTAKTAVDALDKLAKDPQRIKFLADRKAVDELVNSSADSTFKSLEASWNEITQLRDQSDPSADSGDYANANKMLTDLKTKLTAFKKKLDELKKQKQAYDDALNALQPKLAQTSQSKHAKLDSLVQELATIQGQMEAAAQADDYVKALAILKDLSTKVDAVIKAATELDQQKKEFEDAIQGMQAGLEKASKSKSASVAAVVAEIVKMKGEMDAAAQSEDFQKASEVAKALAPKVTAFEAAQAELEKKYQSALSEAQKAVSDAQGHAQKAAFKTELAALDAKMQDAKTKGDAGDLDSATKVLQELKSNASQTKTTMDMVAKGLAKARAAEVADVTQSLVDSGVDPQKAVEVGQVMHVGGSGNATDEKVVAKEVAKLPLDAIKTMNKNGTKVVACRGSVTDYKPKLKGEHPRDWPAGKTWDTVPGAHMGDSKEVVIATRGTGTPAGPSVPATGNGHGAFDLTVHESMHGADLDGKGTKKHADPAFQAARTKDLAKLGSYFTQAGEAGLEETYAESAARYYGHDPKMQTDWPNLYAYWDSQPK